MKWWTVYSCPEHGAVSAVDYDSKTDTHKCGVKWRKGMNGYCGQTLTAHTVDLDRQERLEKGLRAAWDALKWKRMNPLDQIDEARDIIDDTLERPRINGVKAKLGDPTSRYPRYGNGSS